MPSETIALRQPVSRKKTAAAANGFIVLMLFLFYQGFYLLPEKLVVIPGVFRMSDSFFCIILFLPFFFRRTFVRFREESLLVLGFSGLMVLSCIMGHIFFPQTSYDGLLAIRGCFFWLSFFIYIPLIRNVDRADRLLRLLTLLFGIYVVVLLFTKYFPNIGFIHFPEQYYNTPGSTTQLTRFGEARLFFPYSNIPIMLYYIALARLIYKNAKESRSTRISLLLFVLVVGYAAISSYTRAVVFPLLIVTAFAFFTSGRKILKFMAVATVCLCICVQGLSIALTGGGSAIETTKVGKLTLRVGELSPETGRKLQMSMYLTQFMRSPLTGVGSFAVRGYGGFEGGELRAYKKYGFFNGSDIGYLKLIGENGLLGLIWLVWWYLYYYRKGRLILKRAVVPGNAAIEQTLCRGLLHFVMYLLMSGVTLAHFDHPGGITILPLSLALIALIRVSVGNNFVDSGQVSPVQTLLKHR